jgi:hypothetical protein
MSAHEDATDILTRQHRELESALRAALALEDGAARRSRFLDAADALAIHIASEEQLFYPAVHRDPTEDILLESLEEHLSLKRLVADLLALPGDAPTFEPKLHVLLEQAEHHHREEEDKLFPRSRRELGAQRLEVLGAEMQALQAHLQQEGKPRKAVLDQTGAAEPLR